MKGRHGTYRFGGSCLGWTYFSVDVYARIPRKPTLLNKSPWKHLLVYQHVNHESVGSVKYATPEKLRSWERDAMEAYEKHYDAWGYEGHRKWSKESNETELARVGVAVIILVSLAGPCTLFLDHIIDAVSK